MELLDKYSMKQLRKIMVRATGDNRLKLHDGRKYCDCEVWAETKAKTKGYCDDEEIVQVLCDSFFPYENPRFLKLAILDNGMVGLFQSGNIDTEIIYDTARK